MKKYTRMGIRKNTRKHTHIHAIYLKKQITFSRGSQYKDWAVRTHE